MENIAPISATRHDDDVAGPFMGPRPFSRDESTYFFGRDSEAKRLGAMVAASTLSVLYGATGAGKTSLLNAKLPEQLDQIAPDWIIINFSSWQGEFLNALASTAFSKISSHVGVDLGRRISSATLSSDLTKFSSYEDYSVLLVLDQFEEYFLYHPRGLAAFEKHLSALGNQRNSDVHILLTLRSDRFFLLDRLRRSIPEIYRNLLRVEPLDEDGATAAIEKPISVYNVRYRPTPSEQILVEPDLISALIKGSDDEVIRQRLPGRGRGQAGPVRGETPENSHVKRRIVAPFLQLALKAVWVEDVERQKRKVLSVSTLRRLASRGNLENTCIWVDYADVDNDTTEDYLLVGLLVQRHLDRILDRPPEVQEVAAKVFDRMVTNSGGKVAVSFPDDFGAILTSGQMRLAMDLLSDLSSAGENAVVRRGGADENVSGENRFEIVHDALAGPLLDWILRWRRHRTATEAAEREREQANLLLRQTRETAERALREERERAESARLEELAKYRRVIRGILGAIMVALLIVCAILVASSYERRLEFSDLAISESRAPGPDYRKRLIMLLASWRSWNDGVVRWMPNFLAERAEVATEIVKSLQISPVAGGDFDAVGARSDGAQFASLDEVRKDVRVYETETGNILWSASLPENLEAQLTPSSLDRPEPKVSRIQTAAVSSAFPPVIGFVDDLSFPVIYFRGILYYWDKNGWKAEDIADHILGDIAEIQALPIVEITGGTILCRFSRGFNTPVTAIRLAFSASSGMAFEKSEMSQPIPSAELGLRPIFSPRSASMPDRFAYLRPKVSDALPGQLNRTQVVIGDLRGTSRRTLEFGAPATLKDAIAKTEGGGISTLQPSIAFVSDGAGLMVRRGSQIYVFTQVGSSNPDSEVAVELHVNLKNVTSGQGDFGTRPLAAARVDSKWHAAWLQPDGIIVAKQDGNSNTMTIWPTEPLLSGLRGGFRLSFSPDGRYLMLQRQMFPEKASLRIWDLTPGAIDPPSLINNLLRKDGIGIETDSKIARMICRRARIDPQGSLLTETERPRPFQGIIGDPCS